MQDKEKNNTSLLDEEVGRLLMNLFMNNFQKLQQQAMKTVEGQIRNLIMLLC